MSLVCTLLTLYIVALFGRIILSWFPVQPGGVAAQVSSFLYSLTEPVLGPVRRVMPAVRLGGMGLDLSPILVLFGIRIVQGVIC